MARQLFPILLGFLLVILSGCYQRLGTEMAVNPPAPPVAFAPSDASSLQLWLRSDRGVYKNTANEAAADGDTVLSWVGVNAANENINFTSASGPQFKNTGSDAINGNPTIKFSGGWWGAGQNLIANLATTLAGEMYGYYVAKFDTVACSNGGSWCALMDGPTDISFGFEWGFNSWPALPASNVALASDFDVPQLYQVHYAASGEIKVDGSSYAINANPIAGINKLHLGSRGACSWNGNNPCQYFNGNIAEIVVLSPSASQNDRDQLVNYLKERYGISQ